MKEVRHPAEKILYNEHGYVRVSDDLKSKMDRAGIPVMNLVAWTGCVMGMLVYFLDELTEEVVFQWYEPGERLPSIRLPDKEDVAPLFEKFKQKAGIKVATPAKVYDDEDDEL